MEFGICTSIENSAAVSDAGWDFIEESVQGLLKGLESDENWTGRERAKQSAVPIRAGNMLVPASLKITGPDVDRARLAAYMRTVFRRADKLDIRTLVFGSGGARNVPEGFPRDTAAEQITEFVRTSAAVAAEYDVTIVIEPLHRGECNIINSVDEAMKYVATVGHPNLKCLVDSYHSWMEDEPLEDVRVAMPSIRHVHVADKTGRTAPGESGESDYRPLFRVLKHGGYNGLISVEAKEFNVPSSGARVLEFLRTQWCDA